VAALTHAPFESVIICNGDGAMYEVPTPLTLIRAKGKPDQTTPPSADPGQETYGMGAVWPTDCNGEQAVWLYMGLEVSSQVSAALLESLVGESKRKRKYD
jgi:hypothetical protein